MKKWYFLISLILVSVSSCGTRKVEMQLQKARTEELREIVLKLQNDIRNNVRITKIGQTKILEPIVPDQPSNYNGETFQNTKVTITETQSDSTAIITETSKKEVKDNTKKEVVTKDKTKDSKSKKPNPWLWIGLVVILCFGGWLIWKGKKD